MHAFSRNSIYPLSRDETFSGHIKVQVQVLLSKRQTEQNRRENLLQRYAYTKHHRFNISAKQDLPLPDSRIGASVIQCDYTLTITLLTFKKHNLIKSDTDHCENLPSS